MATLEDLYSQKKKYESLEEDIDDIIDDLDKAISYIEDAVDFCGDNYKINGDAADRNKISKIKNSMISNRDDLKDKIAPAIDTVIKKIKTEISTAETA